MFLQKPVTYSIFAQLLRPILLHIDMIGPGVDQEYKNLMLSTLL